MDGYHHGRQMKKQVVGVKLMREPGFAAPNVEAKHKKGLVRSSPKEEIFKSTPALNINKKPATGERRALSSISFYSSDR